MKLTLKFHGKKIETTESIQESSVTETGSYEVSLTRSGGEAFEKKLQDGDAVQLTFDDGVEWIARPEDLPQIFNAKEQISKQKDLKTKEFELPAFIEVDPENRTRGGKRKFFLKVLKFFKIKPEKEWLAEKAKETADGKVIGKGAGKAAEITATTIAYLVDSQVKQEGLYLVAPDLKLQRFENEKDLNLSKPILILVHGTASTTRGSFAGFLGTKEWDDILEKYGNNVLAFENKTFGRSTLQNAIQLAKELPEGGEFHFLSFSRGGIIADLIIRISNGAKGFLSEEIEYFKRLINDGKNISDNYKLIPKQLEVLNSFIVKGEFKVTRHVRVGSPANGTLLLSKRTDWFFNVLFNLIATGVNSATGYASKPVVMGIKKYLISVVAQKNDPDVLPGLEAMNPDSELLKLTNREGLKLEGELILITSNAKPRGVLRSILWGLVRSITWKSQNDFVVHSRSMFEAQMGREKVLMHHLANNKIHHLNYFKNRNSRESISKAVLKDFSELPSNFKKPEEWNVRGLNIVPGGALSVPSQPLNPKGILIMLPGIMGSNLSHENNRIWFEVDELLKGNVSKLEFSKKGNNISADSMLKSHYESFAEYFVKKGYHVLPFPFDWRLSVMNESKRLKALIANIPDLYKELPIHIAAHSMGGLVVRDLMINEKNWSDYKEKNNIKKCILFGTPWMGSYLIPEVLTGMGKRIDQISYLTFMFQSKKKLLKMFVEFPGIFELLPLNGHDFENVTLWKTISKARKDWRWQIPDEKELDAFKTYKNKTLEAIENLELEDVFYIAGDKSETVCNFVFETSFGDEIDLKTSDELKSIDYDLNNGKFKFKTTNLGDGSVTWKDGKPHKLKDGHYFFMPVEHMDLMNEPNYYDAILEIFETGTTEKLETDTPKYRSGEVLNDKIEEEPYSKNSNAIARGIFGLDSFSYNNSKEDYDDSEIKVTLKNGDLKYANYPLLIGHFIGDGIVNAEGAMNQYLEGQLSEYNKLGQYPGPIGSNFVIIEQEENELGAIIVGLGNPEDLTPALLAATIKSGCLKYSLSARNQKIIDENETMGISTLLIGSGYANIPLQNSLSAILGGVREANREIESIGNGLRTIQEVEFIELYEGKSFSAFNLLNEMQKDRNFYKISLDEKIRNVEGRRILEPRNYDSSWWRRITSVERERHGRKFIHFTSSTGRSSIQEREQYPNPEKIFSLLSKNNKFGEWNQRAAKPLFEMLIPNDFKVAFMNKQNLLLIIDKVTANYPWELLHYDGNAKEPICVAAGMIRQLKTRNDDYSRPWVKENKALIIGDPHLSSTSKYKRLTAARIEAQNIFEKIKGVKFKVKEPLIDTNSDDIYYELYEEHRVIHVAAHGVIDHEVGDLKESGILIGDNTVLNAFDFKQLPYTPDLVFLNCCYLGQIDNQKEIDFRNRFKMAANLGIQLMENGVKAVIVAGWEVEDNAAQLFAETFYDSFLKGENFADSVLKARQVCHNEYPNWNTWGAYQCYGEPHFKLTKRRVLQNNDSLFSTEKDALRKLEIFINTQSSFYKQRYNQKKILQEIVEKIEKSNVETVAVIEKIAKSYDVIGEESKAIEYLEILLKKESANFSFKLYERYLNLKAKFAANQEVNDKNRNKLRKDIKIVIEQIKSLIKFAGATNERKGILGSAYKRNITIELKIIENCKSGEKDKEKDIKPILIKMKDQYFDAFLSKNSKTYFCLNWLTGESILNIQKDKNGELLRTNKVYPELGEKTALDYLKMKEESLEKNANARKQRKNFWDWIEIVNVNQCKLLYTDNSEEQRKILQNIKKTYTRAWKIGGNQSNRNSEIEQTEFALRAVQAFYPEKFKKGLIPILEELKEFFENG